MPCYNEWDNVFKMYELLENYFTASSYIKKVYDFEYIYVNDWSKDHTWDEITKLNHKDSKVHWVNFSRNYWKEIALTAWVEYAKWDAVITMDSDWQHPVDKIINFLVLWEEWYQIIYQKRSRNLWTSAMRQMCSNIFYSLLKKSSTVSIDSNSTDYRLMDRVVVDTFLKFKEKNRMFRWIVDLVWFKKTWVEFEALERLDDQPPRYTLSKLLQLSIISFTSFGSWPLHLLWIGWIVLILLSLVVDIIWVIWYTNQIFSLFWLLMWLSMWVVLFCCWIILVALWIASIYIGKIYDEVKQRPLYTVSDTTENQHVKKTRNETLQYLAEYIDITPFTAVTL